MIYLIFDTETREYELYHQGAEYFGDIIVNDKYYFDYPPRLYDYSKDSTSRFTSIDNYMRSYPELIIINSFDSVDDYNDYLDNSPELFV